MCVRVYVRSLKFIDIVFFYLLMYRDINVPKSIEKSIYLEYVNI